jgi:hypothetical protein
VRDFDDDLTSLSLSLPIFKIRKLQRFSARILGKMKFTHPCEGAWATVDSQRKFLEYGKGYIENFQIKDRETYPKTLDCKLEENPRYFKKGTA